MIWIFDMLLAYELCMIGPLLQRQMQFYHHLPYMNVGIPYIKKWQKEPRWTKGARMISVSISKD